MRSAMTHSASALKRAPDKAKSRHVLSVAKRLSDTVRAISDATVETYRLGIVDGASKLDIRTANVYWHPELRCWLVGLREDEPAGRFWEDQLLQYEWDVIVLNQVEQTPYAFKGNRSLDRLTDSGRSLSIANCGQCATKTYHDDHTGCLSCAAHTVSDVPALLLKQLEAYDKQVVEIGAKRVKVESTVALPLSLVAMGMARLAAAKVGGSSAGFLVNSGRPGYNAAGTILRAYIILSGLSEVDRKAFAKRFFPYVEASPSSLAQNQWWSIVALAFDVAVRQGRLSRTERKDVYKICVPAQAD